MERKLEDIGRRIQSLINHSGTSRQALGEIIGVGEGAVGRYVRGETDPGAISLAKIAEWGNVSIEWLITGTGYGLEEGHSITKEQLSHYIHGTDEPPKGLTMADAAIMRAVIEGIEEHLAAQELDLRPEKKADLVLTLFEMCVEEGKEVDKATIIRLVKLAA